MKFIYHFLIHVSLLIFVFSVVANAQTRDEVLAKIGAQNLTVNDLDAEAQIAAEQLPPALAAARSQALDQEIAALLFAAEAAARGVSRDELLRVEVENKVQNPTAEQVEAVYAMNRQAFGEASLDAAKLRIVNYLRAEQTERLTKTFADALKAKHNLKLRAENIGLNAKPTDVLASVGANNLLVGQFLERTKLLEYNLRLQTYQQIKAALDAALYSNLIFRLAQQQNSQPEDIIKTEISDKLRQPTETDALRLYNERKAEFGAATFDDLKTQILTFLSEQQRARLEQALRERLIKQFAVQILLKEPVAPVLKIETANHAARGAATAPVTIVMFTDFECSACARTHPILMQAIKPLAAKIRFVVRNFPLETVHEHAFRAAQAAAAARAQNKFFEYAELLYQNQKSLDDASLKRYAQQIGLNVKQFEADLNSNKFDAQIRQDLADGDLHGIRATPSIFVNGVIVNDLSAAGLQKAIERQLVKK